MIALDEKAYTEWRVLLDELGAPRNYSCAMLNDFIKGQVAVVKHLSDLKRAGKKVTMSEALKAYAEMHKAAGTDEEL